MKIFMKVLCLCLAALVVTGCKAAQDDTTTTPTGPSANNVFTISSKSTSGFTVTWTAASDAVTPAASLQYMLVYSTSNNITTVATAQANGTVALNWTANTLTANLSSLNPSTTYYLAVLVKNGAGATAIATSSTVTLCSGKKMFLATVSSANFGGAAGADSACAAQRPGNTGTYKAVIADGTNINSSTGLPGAPGGRQACFGNCEASNLYVQDWALAANTTYCTADFATKIGTSGVTYPVLYVSTPNVLSATATKLFTGFNISWGTAYASTCSNWTSTAGTFVGGTTTGVYTGSGNRDLISTFPFPNCAGAGAVICAEQ